MMKIGGWALTKRAKICGRLHGVEDGGNTVRVVKPDELRRLKRVKIGGDVHVMGSVEADETVYATGSVAIWGSLKGCVCAGEESPDATIRALDLGPRAKVTLAGQEIKQANKSARLILHSVPSYPGSEAAAGGTPSAEVRAAFATGCYAVVLGLIVMRFPLSAYGLLFDLSLVSPGLIRLGGSFLCVIGLQYLGTAVGDSPSHAARLRFMKGFYRSTVVSRFFLVAVVGLLVLRGALERAWLLFAGMNAIGALAMLKAVPCAQR